RLVIKIIKETSEMVQQEKALAIKPDMSSVLKRFTQERKRTNFHKLSSDLYLCTYINTLTQ
ncbi:hypothetical protein ACQP3J_32055, partial [Escherichia coli]